MRNKHAETAQKTPENLQDFGTQNPIDATTLQKAKEIAREILRRFLERLLYVGLLLRRLWTSMKKSNIQQLKKLVRF